MNRNKALVTAVALIVSGCATLDSKVISWDRIEHTKLQSMCKQGAESDLSKATIYGCAFWSNADNHCHIYTSDIMRLHSAQEQCVLGHEVTHCFDKNYHRGQLWHVDCTKAERK